MKLKNYHSFGPDLPNEKAPKRDDLSNFWEKDLDPEINEITNATIISKQNAFSHFSQFHQPYTPEQRIMAARAKTYLEGSLDSCVQGLEIYVRMLYQQSSSRPLFRDQGTIGKIYNGLQNTLNRVKESSQDYDLGSLHLRVNYLINRLATMRNGFESKHHQDHPTPANIPELEQQIWQEIHQWAVFYVNHATPGMEHLDHHDIGLFKIGLQSAEKSENHQSVLQFGIPYCHYVLSDLEAVSAVAQSAFHQQQWEAAFTHGRKSISHINRTKSTPNKRRTKQKLLLATAVSAHHLGHHDLAVRFGQDYLEKGGHNPELSKALALSYQQLNPNTTSEDLLSDSNLNISQVYIAHEIAQAEREQRLIIETAKIILKSGRIKYDIAKSGFIAAYLIRDYDQAFEFLWKCMDAINLGDQENSSDFTYLIDRMLEISATKAQWDDFEYWAQEYLIYAESPQKYQVICSHALKNENPDVIAHLFAKINDPLLDEALRIQADPGPNEISQPTELPVSKQESEPVQRPSSDPRPSTPPHAFSVHQLREDIEVGNLHESASHAPKKEQGFFKRLLAKLGLSYFAN